MRINTIIMKSKIIQTCECEYMMRYNNKHWNRHSRSAQYAICRALGFNIYNSLRMRDWSLSHVAQLSNTKILGTTQ
jgi:hypothetical protein